MEILEWINIFPGTCPQRIFAWTQYRPIMKIFASHMWKKSWPAIYDLLTSFRQGNLSVVEWYNAVKAQMCLVKYPSETASILHRDIFCFSLKDEDFVSKAINECSVKLQKFPVSKVRQLAKKMEASKATMHHIRQVASYPQVAQINLMRHQRTDLLGRKSKWKQQSFRSRSKSHKRYLSEHKQQVPPYKKKLDPNQGHKRKDSCSKCGDSKHVEGSRCPARMFHCKICNKYGHCTSLY